ncbi:unnamed protein product, partial [marine sediment metagenome]
RLGREPWPFMVEALDSRMRRYGGVCAHDATGLGNVVNDLIDYPVTPVVLVGRVRQEIFNEYISAIEQGSFMCPRIEYMYGEHKYLRLEDLYGRGHPPDSVVAGAIAWHMRDRATTMMMPPLIDEFEVAASNWDI